MPYSPTTLASISYAIEQQSLPKEFVETISKYYHPLGNSIAQKVKGHSNRSVHFVGIQGSQGSGKSTCASFLKLLLESEHELQVVVASIDDFYLTRAERKFLAQNTHALFAVRGVPGTHDVAMMQSVFDRAEAGQTFTVPAFDKATDDRAPESDWQSITRPVDVVILEGWCVGVVEQSDQDLRQPVNRLEELEDPDCLWRKMVNDAIKQDYKKLFDRLDLLICLQAPSFDCVLGWRQLQEQKMIEKLQSEGKSIELAQTPKQIERFISHYQRLTEHAIKTLPLTADYVLTLNEHHAFTDLRARLK